MEEKYYSIYNEAYKDTVHDYCPPGLIKLFKEAKQRIDSELPNILELGCGPGALTHELSKYSKFIVGVDISPRAIEIASKRNPALDFRCIDIVEERPDESFDIIIDSHLVHCLALDEDREKYFSKIAAMLNDGGICIIETMVESKTQFFPANYSFNNGILHKNLYKKLIPYRCIRTTIELENEVLKIPELTIETLNFPLGLKFQIDQLPIDTCPDVAQILLRKKR